MTPRTCQYPSAHPNTHPSTYAGVQVPNPTEVPVGNPIRPVLLTHYSLTTHTHAYYLLLLLYLAYLLHNLTTTTSTTTTLTTFSSFPDCLTRDHLYSSLSSRKLVPSSLQQSCPETISTPTSLHWKYPSFYKCSVLRKSLWSSRCERFWDHRRHPKSSSTHL